jgi:TolA-binding protein
MVMKKYLLLVLLPLIVISCSKTSDQEYFDQAKKLLDEKKTTEAVASLEALVNEYPESEIAPAALVQLAQIYQNQMDKTIKPAESFKKAEKYFMQVYEKYPDSEEAPKSLFMSGFILANDLMKFDEATSSYNLFLEKYPSHPLAVSAKEELDNMGLSPEEILKRTETVVK